MVRRGRARRRRRAAQGQRPPGLLRGLARRGRSPAPAAEVKLPPALARALRDLAARAASRGQRAAVVGGCVRDALLGRPTRDLDVMAEGDAQALAQECAAAWGAKVETFGRFGTARLVLPGGDRLDLASARAESYPEPAALPVVRPATLEDDLARRDFSVNALARLALPEGLGPALDPFGGAADLKARRLRVLHPGSFRDDPTRLFRAARYAGRLSLKPDAGTLRLIRESVARRDPALLSRERVRQELWRILEEKDPGPALRLCTRWGLSAFFHPKFKAPAGLSRFRGPLTRLGLCALTLGKDAEEFLRSLPLPREDAAALLAALKAVGGKAAPSQALPEAAAALVRAKFPRLPKAALGPRLVTGTDLVKAGLTPGPLFTSLLEDAARAQWAGRLKDRAGAAAFLRRAARREK
ncbi:CCA tRNA nucleotidyltransferase [bacterium]|nr:MAG: CCA tRNA nucleotidyltransferase [bacterium]